MLEASIKSEGVTVERIKTAEGLVANIKNLELEALGVKTDRSCIVNNDVEAAPYGVQA